VSVIVIEPSVSAATIVLPSGVTEPAKGSLVAGSDQNGPGQAAVLALDVEGEVIWMLAARHRLIAR
jgi:hypothetical protein